MKPPRFKLETWKRGKYWVLRDKKGVLITFTTKKKGVFKADVEKTYKEYKTLNQRVINYIKRYGVISEKRIGKNTVVKVSDEILPKQDYYQVTCVIDWGTTETVGYSNIKGSKEQAFDRALADAINQNIITYKYTHIPKGNTGVYISPDGKKYVYYTVSYKYQTYVKSYETPQTQKI